MLSARATDYLAELERRPLITDAGGIRDAFTSRSLPCPAAIIEFQIRFGGTVLYAGLAPMIATILHPQANFLLDRPWNVPDVTDETGILLFNCINTLYQMEFHLDESGRYYEGWEPVHESFEKHLEGNAFLATHSSQGKWTTIHDAETKIGNNAADFRSFGLEIDEFASCQYTTFWYNDAIIVRHRGRNISAWRNEESQITKR